MNVKSRSFYCPRADCVATFKTQLGYKRHLKRHSGIYQYYCPYCKKGLGGTRHGKEHLRTDHTGRFGFHCVTCSKAFSSIHLLTTHLEEKSCSAKN